MTSELYRAYGLDLRGYAAGSLERRVSLAAQKLAGGSIAGLTQLLLADSRLLHGFIDQISVQVTDMFRDPWIHRAFRSRVVPLLRHHPFLRMWVAGCASGEEAYSLAILLEEEGLYDRTQIFATDLSARAIAQAKRGLFAARNVRRFTENYQCAGGTASFSDYYTAGYEQLAIRDSLRRNISFFQHDLVSDYVFGAMHVLLCRNVFIYFDRALRVRVLSKLERGLLRGAFVCLGSSEQLADRATAAHYATFEGPARIYRWQGSGPGAPGASGSKVGAL